MSVLTRAGGPLLAAALLFASPAFPSRAGAAEVQVDAAARTVRIPALAAEQGKYEVLKGAIEYVLVSKGGKEYETLFVTECPPEDIRRALAQAGFTGGKPGDDDAPATGARASIVVEEAVEGKTVRRPVDELIVRVRTGERLAPKPWVFTGSTRGLDPDTGQEVFQCAVTRSLVGLHLGDPSPLFQNSRPEARDDNIYRADVKALPPPRKAVTLVIAPYRREIAPDTRRAHVFVSGRVQGVGFRAYTEGEARRLKLEGFVKNLADGRVEAVIEGPKERVAELIRKIEKGPRAARVQALDAKDEPPTGEFDDFRVEY